MKESNTCGHLNKRIIKNREQYLFGFAAAFCIFAFAITLIRAAVTAITYDEASTYLRFSEENFLSKDVLYWYYSGPGCIANNHWLNSFLIWGLGRMTGIRYSEFMIRFPVLVIYAVYLFAVCQSFRKRIISFPVLILLVGNYYLNEFYGLARGYGMANTFVFLFCLCFIYWKKSDFRSMKYLNLGMVCAILATLSNTIVLLLYPAVGCVCLYRLITKKQFKNFLKKCLLVFLVFLAVMILMLVYHFNITAEGKSLYTGKGSFFDDVIKGYIGMFISKTSLITAVAWGLTAVIILSAARINKDMQDLDFGIMMFLFFIINIAMHFLTQKGYIATRVLLPFYGFIVLAVSEIIGTAVSKTFMYKEGIAQNIYKSAAAALCIVCICLFAQKINLNGTKDWRNDYRYRTLENGSAITGEPHNMGLGHPSSDFYIKKNEMTVEEFYSYLR